MIDTAERFHLAAIVFSTGIPVDDFLCFSDFTVLVV